MLTQAACRHGHAHSPHSVIVICCRPNPSIGTLEPCVTEVAFARSAKGFSVLARVVSFLIVAKLVPQAFDFLLVCNALEFAMVTQANDVHLCQVWFMSDVRSQPVDAHTVPSRQIWGRVLMGIG